MGDYQPGDVLEPTCLIDEGIGPGSRWVLIRPTDVGWRMRSTTGMVFNTTLLSTHFQFVDLEAEMEANEPVLVIHRDEEAAAA